MTINFIINKLQNLWKSDTPKIAVYLQYISGIIACAVAALAVFWTSLPQDWIVAIPQEVKANLAYIGGGATVLPFILQLFKKSGKDNITKKLSKDG